MESTKSSMKSLKAYEIIRDMILRGEKLPGSRLILYDLEEELNIGRGPIREALMRLDRTGLIKNIPYKGAIVGTPPTEKEIFHIFDLRIDLEAKLAAEAMENITDADILKLEELHVAMQQTPKNHHHLDSNFHFLIYDASNLPHLCNIARTLRGAVESVLNIYRRDKEHSVKFNKEHDLIIEALKNQDREGLKKSIAINIESGLEIIKETYATIVRMPY
ncbi:MULTISPECIES: GntR family transcriptional regulator [Desulfosediminicola]|uniref:GntR family transcriptional regulator n=1 Tax=Desulfosediminicola TaxID=2886823 RepID=UPI0010ABFD30|nr:GntR family transcriptional regulator [Desulfosediminicola ganghwensis]